MSSGLKTEDALLLDQADLPLNQAWPGLVAINA